MIIDNTSKNPAIIIINDHDYWNYYGSYDSVGCKILNITSDSEYPKINNYNNR